MPTSFSDDPEESAPDPAEVAARRVGEVFAEKWRIERVLGAGGMATVYGAIHTNNQRTVALKVLHPELTASGDIKKRFLREGFIANRIGHPGAVSILDDGVDDAGNVFLVMELLSGSSVADRIRAARDSKPPKRAFDEAEALRIADGVLDVLVAAHAQGILHRDLKPDNVFVTETGEVKVLDFGIARLREPQSGSHSGEGDEAKTRTGVVLGTPQYMAPEQARGRTSLVDERSDLWAVGAIVFAMLTRRHVHEAETPNEALLKAMTAKAAPLGSILPGVDPKVAEIVNRALAFEQEARFPNARAMQAEVREVMLAVGPGGAELAPTSRASLSGAKPITAVTRSAGPIVRDTHGGRSSGLRVVSVVIAIGLSAVAGRALLVRFAPVIGGGQAVHAGRDAGVPVKAAGGSSPLVPGPTHAPARPDAAAAAAALPAEVPDASLALASVALDAGADAEPDAEADEEDDDGGEDEEDEVVVESPSPAAGHAARGAVPARHAASPPHKGEPRKKGKKKKKKRR